MGSRARTTGIVVWSITPFNSSKIVSVLTFFVRKAPGSQLTVHNASNSNHGSRLRETEGTYPPYRCSHIASWRYYLKYKMTIGRKPGQCYREHDECGAGVRNLALMKRPCANLYVCYKIHCWVMSSNIAPQIKGDSSSIPYWH